ncbi:MAG: hypothetical protein IJI75_01765 [Solobacterium sp.]|jgi:hypothetical protein|nr:hypothetical protein [Solobacterium sp.]
MKTFRHALREALIRIAVNSLPGPSRSGFYQNDMRELKKKLSQAKR